MTLVDGARDRGSRWPRLTVVAAPEKEVRARRGAHDRHRAPPAADRDRQVAVRRARATTRTSIEEIAQRANVSKPVVYEHFGGKEGLYAVVVDREMSALLDGITSSLTNNRSRVRVERVALALLTYVEERTDGFRILIRDSPASIASGTYSSLLNDAVSQVASILAGDFSRRGLDPELAPLYAQALVGSVSMTAQWWLDTREPKKEVVAAHLVNLMWNGLTHLEADPELHDAVAVEWPVAHAFWAIAVRYVATRRQRRRLDDTMTTSGHPHVQTPMAGLVRLALSDPGLADLTRRAADAAPRWRSSARPARGSFVAAALAQAGPAARRHRHRPGGRRPDRRTARRASATPSRCSRPGRRCRTNGCRRASRRSAPG